MSGRFFLVIGSELTKEERTCLHRNVRLAFPHLQTETIKNEQEVNYPAKKSFQYCIEVMQGHLKQMGKVVTEKLLISNHEISLKSNSSMVSIHESPVAQW